MTSKSVMIGCALLAGALVHAAAQRLYAWFHEVNLEQISLDAGGSAQHRYDLWSAKAAVIEAGNYRVLIPPAGQTHASLIVQAGNGSAVVFSRFSDRDGLEVLSSGDSTGLFVLWDEPRGSGTRIVLRNSLSASHEVWTVNNPHAYGLIEQRVVLSRNENRKDQPRPTQTLWTIDASIHGKWSADLKEAQIVRGYQGEEYVIDGVSRPANTDLFRAMRIIE